MGACLNAKLTRNQRYPAYQLHAAMANKRTSPEEGMKLAALATLHWLKGRLGENAPEEFAALPPLEDYRKADEHILHSFSLNMGFTVDVAAFWEHGLWALCLTEPELDRDEETGEHIQAVPGRVLETGIAFRIAGGQLECGFRTVVSEPVDTGEQARVCCPDVVKTLIEHPDFGLRAQIVLEPALCLLDSVTKLNNMVELWQNKNNALPCVVFTQILPRRRESPLPVEDLLNRTPLTGGKFPLPMPDKLPLTDRQPQSAEDEGIDPPYPMDELAAEGCGYFCAYILRDKLLDKFSKAVRQKVEPGDVVILEPAMFGGGLERYPYKPSRSRQEELMEKISDRLYNYLRGKEVDFGRVMFVREAKKRLLEHHTRELETAHQNSARWEEKLVQVNADWQKKLNAREDEVLRLRDQLARQQEYADRLEREKEELRRNNEARQTAMQFRMEEAEEKAAYLRRKLNQPKEHNKVAEWVNKYFRDRLILHPRAVDLLADKSARDINIETICDALDFLATDYWERRYHQLPNEEMNTRCAEKYGRPFDIRPTGTTTIEFTPTQYKVKYFAGRRGKPVESPLDFHLSVGNDPQNLLRIYFLHDDEKQLIVVGSLPRHLRAVTIK